MREQMATLSSRVLSLAADDENGAAGVAAPPRLSAGEARSKRLWSANGAPAANIGGWIRFASGVNSGRSGIDAG
jgi:hypothetical protein